MARGRGSAPVVGRDHELAVLGERIDDLVDGRGGATVVLGDPGMGKSTLARWAADRAAGAGADVVTATGRELSRSLPFGAVATPLRHRLDRADPALTAGLPSLGLLFDDLFVDGQASAASSAAARDHRTDQTDRAAPPRAGSADLAHARLHGALVTLLERLAAARPTLLVLDDAHWLDASTLALVPDVLDDLPDLPLHVLATARPEPAPGDAELRALRRAVRRQAGREVVIGPLDDEAVAAAIEIRLGGVPPLGLVELVTSRTAGTPLLIEALLDALIEAGALRRAGPWWELAADEVALPAADDLLGDRLAHLDPDARRELGVLAVAGEPVTDDDLAVDGLTDVERRRVLDRLRTAGLATEVVGDDGAARWAPAHPMVGEAADAALAVGERRDLHARFFAAAPTDAPDRRARHLLRAGPLVDPATAAATFAAAGDLALQRGAVVEATRLLTAAVEAQPDITADPLLVVVHEQLGDAWARRGEAEVATDHLLQAYREHERRDDVGAQVRLLGRIGTASWLSTRDRPLANEARALAARLRDEQRWADLALLQSTLMIDHLRRGEWPEARRATSAVGEASARTDDARARLAGEVAAVVQGLWPGTVGRDAPTTVAHLHDLADQARADGHLDVAVRFTHIATDLAGIAGIPELWARAEARARAAAAEGAAASVAWRLTLARLEHAVEHGDLDTAAELVERFDAEQGTTPSTTLLLLRAATGVDGPPPGLRAELEELRSRQPFDDPTLDGLPRTTLAVADVLLAGAEADPASLALLGAPDTPRFVTTHGLATLVAHAEAARILGDPEGTRTWIDQLRRFDGGRGRTSAWADVLDARHADDHAAASLLLGAADRFDTIDRPTSAARAVLAAAGRDLAAVPPDRLAAARRLVAVDEGSGDDDGEAAAAAGTDPGPARATDPRLGPLTAREREVADAVASGLTNREAADELYISVRTVTTHLERIYAKLGIGSRRELRAALAALDAADR